MILHFSLLIYFICYLIRIRRIVHEEFLTTIFVQMLKQRLELLRQKIEKLFQ